MLEFLFTGCGSKREKGEEVEGNLSALFPILVP